MGFAIADDNLWDTGAERRRRAKGLNMYFAAERKNCGERREMDVAVGRSGRSSPSN